MVLISKGKKEEGVNLFRNRPDIYTRIRDLSDSARLSSSISVYVFVENDSSFVLNVLEGGRMSVSPWEGMNGHCENLPCKHGSSSIAIRTLRREKND